MFESLVAAMVSQSQCVARAQGRLLELIKAVADAAPVAEFGVDEVAFALTWTRHAATTQLELARFLIDHLPEVHAALVTGVIDLPKARVFVDVLQTMDPSLAKTVAAQVLPIAGEKTVPQLRDRLHRRALAADPEHARKRRARAIADRRVLLESTSDGTAVLTAIGLPPARAVAAFERVNAIARARKLAGSTLRMDQLRADTLLDLLEGVGVSATPAARRGVIELTVSLETLAGLSEDPGDLRGYGPVGADIARRLADAAGNSRWQFSVIDPDGGLVFQGLTRARPTSGPSRPPGGSSRPTTPRPTDVPPSTRPSSRPDPSRPGAPVPTGAGSYPAGGRPGQGEPISAREPGSSRPSTAGGPELRGPARVTLPPPQDPDARSANAATTRWITMRDKACRAPGCRAPATACDLDHTVDFGRGGRTTHDNLGPFCRHHHRLKHEGGWTVRQDEPGVFSWLSPSGRVYEVGPEPPGPPRDG